MEALSKLLLFTKAYSELDEPKTWLTLADKYSGKPPLADLKGHIEGLKGKDPGSQVNDTVKAAWEMAYALEELRNETGTVLDLLRSYALRAKRAGHEKEALAAIADFRNRMSPLKPLIRSNLDALQAAVHQGN